MKTRFLILLCVLVAAGAWLLWPSGHQPSSSATKTAVVTAPATLSPAAQIAARKAALAAAATNSLFAKTNRLAYRLSNTTKTIGQLASDRHAILLDNALIQTDAKMDLKIPAHLRATGEPGAYIVQSRGVIDGAFRVALADVGAKTVSYIPNNALLVQLTAAGAAALKGNSLVQAVLPYDPYFKVQSSLLGLAVKQQPLAKGTFLTLGLFSGGATATAEQIQKLGGIVVATDRSPFGPIVRVQPPANWLALAQLPGVQLLEPAHRRVAANDLSRSTMGVAATSVVLTNYLNLTGTNVIVEVNDTGISTNHPDLLGRVFLDAPGSGNDTDGHGTFIAGQIAGSGLESTTVTNAQGSIMPGTNGQFRGKAPAASLFSVGAINGYYRGGLYESGNDDNFFVIGQTNFFLPGAANYVLGPAGETNYFYVQYPDWYLQEAPAATNALISNNSWGNEGANEYDLAAASYDAAVRDALPEKTGPQPVLFVFAAGNRGNADGNYNNNNNGGGGTPDTIASPATAKNVITVGALEQQRGITNTYLPFGSTNPVAAWYGDTDDSSQVAGFSARGNVGIGTEGTYGRFKPDVVAPGTFVISTRSTTWDEVTYYNPTNFHNQYRFGEIVDTNSLNYYSLSDFGFNSLSNVVSISIQIRNTVPNGLNMPIYVSITNFPDENNKDFATSNNAVNIPVPDGGLGYLANIINNGDFNFSVGNPTNVPVKYNLFLEVVTTNDMGDYFQVLSNLNNSIGTSPYYYRYESGTSMAAADVSGVLALMQDYFTNTLHTTPSPALLKAMLINGARLTGFYNLQVNNTINYEGWGLVNLPNSIPPTLTNTVASTNNSVFFIDQSPTNALATGDTRTYQISIPPTSQTQPLRVTLAWTDPPGNPAAAIKLVNNLSLTVSNLDNPTNPVVYYGNDIETNQVYNTPQNPTNSTAVLDNINNVQNVFLSPHAGTNFAIVVSGAAVNVNAVTTQTNDAAGIYGPNISQDFVLVVSCGDGSSTNGFSITSTSATSNPNSDQRITVIVATNSPLMNQIVGASSPVMSTNTLAFSAGSPYVTNALLTIGQTNQWHFYVVTNSPSNTPDYTNAAFITFLPQTLAIPRQGVFAGSDANSTLPEANIDLFVASGPGAEALTNLDATVIANCMSNSAAGGSGTFYSSALSRGGTKFIVSTNSAPGQVYYIGVQSEDQMASEYSFLSEFSNIPFSQMTTNGEVVQFFQVEIPDGPASLPGYTNTIGVAIYPMDLRRVIVTNILAVQNAGDITVSLNHSTTANANDTVNLMSHNAPNLPGTYTFVYDDSGQGDVSNSIPSAGPGSLNTYKRQQGQGVWILHASDNAPGFLGNIQGSLLLQPHEDLQHGITVTVQPHSWSYEYIDVPVGYTNLTVGATNVTAPPSVAPPVTLYLNYNDVPTFTNYLAKVDLVNGTPPGGSISYGPPLTPGPYYIGLYNASALPQTIYVIATLAFSASAAETVDYASTGPVPILDDAVTYAYIDVPRNDRIQGFNVGLRVDHPRISDLVFHLISPDGTRYLLMENRGADSTNGCGLTVITTNIVNATANGGAQAQTNYINVGMTTGTFPITYNFYTAPDEMTVYYGTNITSANLILDTGFTNNPPDPGLPVGPQNTLPENLTVTFPPATATASSTWLTIIMNQYGNTNSITQWTYTAGGVLTNYAYLAFTEDTNLTTTPIKFAPTPLVPVPVTNVTVLTNITFSTNSVVTSLSSFESVSAGDYLATSTVDGWTVASNQVSVVNDLVNAQAGSQFLALANGSISRTLTTVPGTTNTLTFAYRGPGITSWWRGENNSSDTVGGNNGTWMSGSGYASGNVGTALDFNGADWVQVPDAPSLHFTNAMTVETWIKLRTFSGVNSREIVSKFGGPIPNSGTFTFSIDPATKTAYYIVIDASGTLSGILRGSTVIQTNQWVHLAGVFDGTTLKIYFNGVLDGSIPWVNGIASGNEPLVIGCTLQGASTRTSFFNGLIDEVSLYNRGISASEIKAIYTSGSAGKFDSALSPPQNLAKAKLTVAGVNTNLLLGANTSWQTTSITFVAPTNGTLLQLDGLEPGMLLDSVSLTSFSAITNLVTNTVVTVSNLYYQAEQSLSPLIDTSAYGVMNSGDPWQLEILDTRAGATNNATLLSWQLEFTFANTNLPAATANIVGNLVGGIPQTNNVVAGSLDWYSYTVPTNASFATNLLLFATLPVNVWFSTNYPPTIANGGDVELVINSTGNTASPYILNTNTASWPYIIPGVTYYLGVQNTNASTVNYAVEVDFDHGNSTNSVLPSLVISSVKASSAGVQLSWSVTSGAQYQVQWKTNLTAAWNTITNPVTTTVSGVSTFTDNGSQSAPLGPMRFYRLVRIP